MAHIFISYAKKDTRKLATKLHRALNQIAGITAWMDDSLEADASWAYQIQDEIDRADYVVVLLSPDVNRRVTLNQRRSFVLNEIDYAQQDNKPILPVMVKRTKMPVQIAGVQYIDLTATPDDPARVVERICNRFDVESPTQVREREQAAEELRRAEAERHEREEASRVAQELKRREREQAEQRKRQEAARIAQEQVRRPTPETAHLPGEKAQDTKTQYSPQHTKTRPKNLIFGLALASVVLAIFVFLIVPNLTRNATPVEREFDGVTMVLVPAGCFMMGSTQEQVDAAVAAGLRGDITERELPQHEQCFDEPFWIDKYPVTNAQYGSSGGWSGDDLPRETVNWFNARDFCEARGGRLPTEAEWEYSARGPDGLIYPWGDEFIADNVVYSANSGNRTADVGSRPGGASWVGALDMSGNVWEWTSSLFEPYPYDADDGRENASSMSARVLRGGSFFSSTLDLRVAVRFRNNPDVVSNRVGFRCARSS